MWENRMPKINKKIKKIKQVSNFNLKSWKKLENKNENENMYQTKMFCNYLVVILKILKCELNKKIKSNLI